MWEEHGRKESRTDLAKIIVVFGLTVASGHDTIS